MKYSHSGQESITLSSNLHCTYFCVYCCHAAQRMVKAWLSLSDSLARRHADCKTTAALHWICIRQCYHRSPRKRETDREKERKVLWESKYVMVKSITSKLDTTNDSTTCLNPSFSAFNLLHHLVGSLLFMQFRDVKFKFIANIWLTEQAVLPASVFFHVILLLEGDGGWESLMSSSLSGISGLSFDAHFLTSLAFLRCPFALSIFSSFY